MWISYENTRINLDCVNAIFESASESSSIYVIFQLNNDEDNDIEFYFDSEEEKKKFVDKLDKIFDVNNLNNNDDELTFF